MKKKRSVRASFNKQILFSKQKTSETGQIIRWSMGKIKPTEGNQDEQTFFFEIQTKTNEIQTKEKKTKKSRSRARTEPR